MKKIFTTAWAGCLLLSLVFPRSILAYETDTHSDMSQRAAAASVLVDRLPDIGRDIGLLSPDSQLSDGGFSFLGFTLFEKKQSVLRWIQEGSEKEDSFLGTRFRNHFYNPLAPAGQEGLSSGLLTGLPSLTWGLEPQDRIGQDFSYRDAKNYFYQGITAATERERKQNLAKLFRTIGQVIHLIQDLGSPQHTRNDSHATGSLYEVFTDRRQIRSNLPFGGYPAVQFPTPDQFWRTPDFKGLANYTNRGFVTAGTNFTGTSDNIQPHPGFPSPDGIGAKVIKMQINDPALLPFLPNKNLTGEIQFISTPVTDSFLGGPAETNPRTSTFSIFDEDLKGAGASQTFTLNLFNFLAAHDFLIKRAVGYSAGLINYFFRGKLEITPPAEGVYGIVDHSKIQQTDPLNGFVGFSTIKLKVRNVTPNNETMAGGTLVAVAKFHRNGCYKDDLTGEFTVGSGGSLVTPCANFRTDNEGIVTSNVLQNVSLNSTPQQFTFTFDKPIPINATDLFLQVVYRGKMGQEDDAVVVATKDIFEPTYISLFNSTDRFLLNGTFFDTTDPALLPTLDQNRDGVIDAQFDRTNLTILFGFTTFSDAPLGAISNLPPARYSRMTILTDRNPIGSPIEAQSSTFSSAGVFNFGAETNQLDTTTNIYKVSAFGSLRGVKFFQSLTFFKFQGTPSGDLSTLPALTDKTPFPVTTLNFQ